MNWRLVASKLIDLFTLFVSIIAPLYGMFWALLVLIIADFMTGAFAAYRQKETIRSRKIGNTVSKIFFYSLVVLASNQVEVHIIPDVPWTKIAAGFIALTELKSVFENFNKIYGIDIMKAARTFFNRRDTSIVWPDTIEVDGCSGGVCYQFTIDCNGTVDLKAHYVWTNGSGEVINEGYAADQAAACLIMDEPTVFQLQVTPSNGPPFSSNVVYFNPLCIQQQTVNLQEYVYHVNETFEVYDILGRIQRKPWAELRPGLYVFRSEHSTFKAQR